MAYYRLEPWGGHEDDRRMATICSTMANIHRGKNKRAYKIDDFMPKFDRVKMHWKDMKQKFMTAFGIK